MDANRTTNKNIMALLKYLQRTREAITTKPRTDGVIATELNIYPSTKSIL